MRIWKWKRANTGCRIHPFLLGYLWEILTILTGWQFHNHSSFHHRRFEKSVLWYHQFWRSLIISILLILSIPSISQWIFRGFGIPFILISSPIIWLLTWKFMNTSWPVDAYTLLFFKASNISFRVSFFSSMKVKPVLSRWQKSCESLPAIIPSLCPNAKASWTEHPVTSLGPILPGFPTYSNIYYGLISF